MARRRSLPQTLGRFGLGVFLLVTGAGHLTFARREFTAQVPDWVPFSKDVVVVASGVAELILGLALLFFARQRVLVGLVVAAFFVAVFPGNLSQWMTQNPAFGLDTDAKRFARLFVQPVFVAWALWSTGAWSGWRGRR